MPRLVRPLARGVALPLAFAAFAACGGSSSDTVDAGGDPDAAHSGDAAAVTHGKDIDESNTGVPAGHTLTQLTGGITIDTPDAVWEDKELTGTITVTADNVTIRNCRIHSTGYFGIQNQGGNNLVVEHCEIDGQAPGQYTGVVGSDLTVRRCNLYGFENPVVAESNVVVEESYIHDLYYAADQHPDGIEWGGSGNGSTVRRNHIVIGPHTGCVNVTPYGGGTANDNTVADNLFAGGSYSLYVRGDGGGTVSDLTVTGNIFVKDSYAYGTHSVVDATGITWSNNTLDDGSNVDL